jgi:crotonobetainyl-CoA:carnitine CoA-transferase CaiB-like acyl-CoA transferase
VNRPEYGLNAGRIADLARLHLGLADVFAALTTGQALALLREAGVPIAAVAGLPEVIRDPLVARALLQVRDPRSGLTVALPAPPTGDAPTLRFPPRLGEHNESVYGALGYSAAQVADLRRRGIV